MTYEDDIIIDETGLSLDLEWIEQPRLMGKYCSLAAEAHRQMELAKERLDFVYATLERGIRMDPEAYEVVPGPRGITEDAIKSAIQIQDEYQEAVRAHIDAKYEYDVANGAVRAFDHRKSSLENLVRLHGQEYFAGPATPRNLSEEKARRERLVHRNVRIGTPEAPLMRRRG